MAVTVHLHLPRFGGEQSPVNSAGVDFSGEPFLEQKRIFSNMQGVGFQLRPNKLSAALAIRTAAAQLSN